MRTVPKPEEGLTAYVVLYVLQELYISEELLRFECWAENEDHAKEQFRDFDPTGVIFYVNRDV